MRLRVKDDLFSKISPQKIPEFKLYNRRRELHMVEHSNEKITTSPAKNNGGSKHYQPAEHNPDEMQQLTYVHFTVS